MGGSRGQSQSANEQALGVTRCRIVLGVVGCCCVSSCITMHAMLCVAACQHRLLSGGNTWRLDFGHAKHIPESGREDIQEPAANAPFVWKGG